jgi:flagellar biosynthetic protein FliR
MRCAGLLATFPQGLGLAVPAPIRGLVAAALALALAPMAHAPHSVTVAGALGELVLGAGLGFCLRLPLLALESAGQAVGFTTTASMFLMQGLPEESGGGGNLWASAYTQIGVLVYFSIGGPQALVQALAGSMRLAPLGGAGWPTALAAGDLTALLIRISALTIILCLPPLMASLVAQWGLGMVFRASARIQLHTFALPLASLAAVGVLALAVPTWPTLLQRSLGWSLEAASGLSAAAGAHP